jgi:hypothetical protein
MRPYVQLMSAMHKTKAAENQGSSRTTHRRIAAMQQYRY